MNLKIILNSMSGKKIYEFDYLQNLCTINHKNVEKDIRKISADIMSLIKNWPQSLVDLEVVDGLCCEIQYREKGKDIKLLYQNKFPENFDELLYVLEGVENE